MHKLTLVFTFLSAADVKKTGSDALHDFELLTLKTIEKYLVAKMIRWHSNFIVAPEESHISYQLLN